MSGDRERLIGMGMSGYVSKPIDQSELLSVISCVLGGEVIAAPASASKQASGDDVFDDLLADLDRMTGS